jgi:BON domain
LKEVSYEARTYLNTRIDLARGDRNARFGRWKNTPKTIGTHYQQSTGIGYFSTNYFELNGGNVMAYDEEQARKSRVVVETPSERREVVHSQSVRTPDNNGISAGMVGVLVVVAIALITMLVLFWLSSQPATENLAAQQPPTVIQQPAPAQQPPVIIQQPAPATTQPAPIIVNPPAGGSTAPTESVNMDSTVQAAVDKRLLDDPELSTLGITASVIDGKVMLVGTVKTEALKVQAERVVKQLKGVKSVDNQITVIP